MTKPYSFLPGRWSPPHEGHKQLVQAVLNEAKPVCIGIRDTDISESNPYSVAERMQALSEMFKREIADDQVLLWPIPDISEICYGRNVGWSIRRIRLDRQTEVISATDIRNSQKRVVWLTGNMGSGKTAIADMLRQRLNAVKLDGDEMCASISLSAGFSKEDRHEHNLRVARLAKVLNLQGLNVVVAVIAPYRATRAEIDEICNPYWVYVEGGAVGEQYPYEIPKNPDVTIQPSVESLEESLEKIIKEVGSVDTTIPSSSS